jgi:hypothetical protein
MQPTTTLSAIPSLLQNRLTFLQNAIQELKQHVKERTQLNTLFLGELDQKICDLDTSLHVLHTADQQRRTGLELEVCKLEQEIRRQKLEFWRDTGEFQSEIRAMQKEELILKVSTNVNARRNRQ